MMARLLLRSHRTGFLVVSVFGMFDVFINTAAYAQVAGHTEAARQAFAAATAPLATQLSYLLPIPTRLDTVGGYVQWRGYPIIAIAFVIWAVVAGSGLVRGEEERGLTEVYLASGIGRVRWTVLRSLGFAVAAALASVLTELVGGAGIALAGQAAGQPLSWSALIGEGVMLLGDRPRRLRHHAGALAAGPDARWRGGSERDRAGRAVLPQLPVAHRRRLARRRAHLALLSVRPDQRPGARRAVRLGGDDRAGRDRHRQHRPRRARLFGPRPRCRDRGPPGVGGSRLNRPARRDAARNPLLRIPILSSLWEQRWSLLGWMVGSFLLMALIGDIAKSGASLIEQTPSLKVWLQPGVAPFTALVAATWGSLVGLVVAGYAIVETARWAGQDGSGRLELTLAEPISRSRVVLRRAVELALGALLIAVAASDCWPPPPAARDDRRPGVDGDLPAPARGHGLWSDWRRDLRLAAEVAIGLVSALAVVAFFIEFLGPLFKWPSWVLNLSVFRLSGTPLTTPIFWNGFWALVAITVVGFGVAVLAMQRREVGS